MEVLQKFRNGRHISCFVAKMPASYIVKTGSPSKKYGGWVNWFGELSDAIQYAKDFNEYCKTNMNPPDLRNYQSKL